MLAGQHATHLHTAAQDVGAEFLGTLKLAGLVRIKQDQRMQVAVTCMEYICHAQAVLLAERCHPAHHVGKTATRNCAVHAQIVRRNAAHSREGGFATGPEQVALFFRLADPHRAGTRLADNRLDPPDQRIDLDLRTVKLDDQQRSRLTRITGVGEILRCLNGKAVHHFHTGRDNACGDDIADRRTRIASVLESDKKRPRRRRLLKDPERYLADHAEKSLGPGHYAHKVIIAGIQMLAAKPQNLTLDRDKLDAEKIVRRQAVFQAVDPA